MNTSWWVEKQRMCISFEAGFVFKTWYGSAAYSICMHGEGGKVDMTRKVASSTTFCPSSSGNEPNRIAYPRRKKDNAAKPTQKMGRERGGCCHPWPIARFKVGGGGEGKSNCLGESFQSDIFERTKNEINLSTSFSSPPTTRLIFAFRYEYT